VHPSLTAVRAEAHMADLHRAAAASRLAPGRHQPLRRRTRVVPAAARLVRAVRSSPLDD
jgi:hypothetical protein